MKKIILIIFSFIIVIFFITGCKKNNAIESDIISFSYNYGSYNEGYYSYSITNKNDEILFTVNGNNGIDLNISKKIDSSLLTQLNNIINDNKIYEWDGYNESDNGVLDGYSFNLKVEYKNGKTIDANGYMKYPKDYNNSHEALTTFLSSIE